MAARALFQPLPVSLFVHLQRQPDRLGRLARRQVHLRRRDRRGRWRLLRAVLAPSRLRDVLARAPLFIVMDAGTFLHISHAQYTCSELEHNILHATHGAL